jgi:transposase
MARPTKLTAEVQERIVQAIRAGNYAEAACQAAGISPSSLYRWLARGQQEPGRYREFRQAVLRAEAEGEVHAVATVRRAMAEDWRAALAYLERRHPARWQRQQRTELTGPDGGPIRTQRDAGIDLSKLSDEELRLLEQLSERAAIDE